jgi:hypothetical protein
VSSFKYRVDLKRAYEMEFQKAAWDITSAENDKREQ